MPSDPHRLAATRSAEAEAQECKRKDNASERALRAMMGGSLATAASTSESWVLPRPEWMSGNPKMFTVEQAKVGMRASKTGLNLKEVGGLGWHADEGGEGVREGRASRDEKRGRANVGVCE